MTTDAQAHPGTASSLSVGERLRELGLEARKGLGQNFLVSAGILKRIVDAAELTERDVVVEVGPGLGVLTDELASRVGRVVALELDRDLFQALQTRYAGHKNVHLVFGDARDIALDQLVQAPQPYKLVANLPYYAANPIVRRFLEAEHRPTLLVVMVQREVAQRMTAKPGDMSILSVATQVYGSVKIVSIVPPGAFRPPPTVTSAIVRIEPHDKPLVKPEDTQGFFGIVRAGFSTPRKQLQGTLSHALGRPAQEMRSLLTSAGIEPTRRAETLSVDEWRKLYEVHRGSGC